jgi:DNA-directed RNA polymerase specialized sigma subunit
LVVVLAFNYGCSVAELGFVLGLSVTGISRIYARAMRTLRARLQAATFA